MSEAIFIEMQIRGGATIAAFSNAAFGYGIAALLVAESPILGDGPRHNKAAAPCNQAGDR